MTDTNVVQPKVIRKFKMMVPHLTATMTYHGGQEYRAVVDKEVDGMSAAIRKRTFTANSHRHALRIFRNWLDKMYPVSDRPSTARASIEDLFE